MAVQGFEWVQGGGGAPRRPWRVPRETSAGRRACTKQPAPGKTSRVCVTSTKLEKERAPQPAHTRAPGQACMYFISRHVHVHARNVI